MAASDWLVDELIANLKRRGNLPTSSESWTDDDFRAIATDEMRHYVVPLIRRLSEEYFVRVSDTSTVAGTAAYDLPDRATGESLRDVQVIDSAGAAISLRRIEPGDVTGLEAGNVGGFYLQDDKVCLVPTPTGAQTLRMKYLLRPSKLVASSGCYKVVTIAPNGDPTLTDLTVVPLDSTVTATAQTTLGSLPIVDVVKAKPGFRIVLLSNSAVASANIVSVLGTAPGVVVGDYVCTEEESPVPQLPAEAHPLLAQAVVCAALRAASAPGLAEAESKLGRMEAELIGLFSPRTENQPRFIVNRYSAGWLSRGGSR
jgi:hypothetical protein